MHRPIGIPNMVLVEHTPDRERIFLLPKLVSHCFGINHCINNYVAVVNALWSEFARQRLGKRPQCMVHSRKCHQGNPTMDVRRRSGKYDHSPAAIHHTPSSFPTGRETGKISTSHTCL